MFEVSVNKELNFYENLEGISSCSKSFEKLRSSCMRLTLTFSVGSPTAWYGSVHTDYLIANLLSFAK